MLEGTTGSLTALLFLSCVPTGAQQELRPQRLRFRRWEGQRPRCCPPEAPRRIAPTPSLPKTSLGFLGANGVLRAELRGGPEGSVLTWRCLRWRKGVGGPGPPVWRDNSPRSRAGLERKPNTGGVPGPLLADSLELMKSQVECSFCVRSPHCPQIALLGCPPQSPSGPFLTPHPIVPPCVFFCPGQILSILPASEGS